MAKASAGAIRAGGAYVSIGADDTALMRTLASAQVKMAKFSGAMRAVGTRLLVTGGAIAAGFGLAVREASAFEEIGSKFKAVFRNLASNVSDWAKQHATATGRSRVDLMKYLATIQDTFVPLGVARDEAAELSKQVVELGVDLASFNNIADPAVLDNLTSALTGMHMAVRKYGVVLSEQSIKQELHNMGIEKGWMLYTPAEKAMARLNLIMQSTTDAQGDAIRTLGSAANQWKVLKAAVKDFAVTVGNAVLPMVISMAKKIKVLTIDMQKWAEENKSSIVQIAEFALSLLKWTVILLAAAKAIDVVRGAMIALQFAFAHPVVIIIAGAIASLKLLVDNVGLAREAWEELKGLVNLGFEVPEAKPVVGKIKPVTEAEMKIHAKYNKILDEQIDLLATRKRAAADRQVAMDKINNSLAEQAELLLMWGGTQSDMEKLNKQYKKQAELLPPLDKDIGSVRLTVNMLNEEYNKEIKQLRKVEAAQKKADEALRAETIELTKSAKERQRIAKEFGPIAEQAELKAVAAAVKAEQLKVEARKKSAAAFTNIEITAAVEAENAAITAARDAEQAKVDAVTAGEAAKAKTRKDALKIINAAEQKHQDDVASRIDDEIEKRTRAGEVERDVAERRKETFYRGMKALLEAGQVTPETAVVGTFAGRAAAGIAGGGGMRELVSVEKKTEQNTAAIKEILARGGVFGLSP